LVDLEDLDKKIIHHLSGGIFSYSDLAKTLGVSRGTIYKRVEQLEKKELILKKVTAIPNYGKLGLTAIFLGVNVEFEGDIDETIKKLQNYQAVNALWKSYGDYQIIGLILCEKGCEGKAIGDFRMALAKKRNRVKEIAIGFDWLKAELAPF